MENIITISKKAELKIALSNLLNKEEVTITFIEDNIFLDNTDRFHSFVLLQTINGMSKIVEGEAVSLKINPFHLINGLKMCHEDEELQIVVNKEYKVWKIIQGNHEHVFSIREIMEINYSDYENRGIHGDYSCEIQGEYSVLKTSVDNLVTLFETVFKAEEYQRYLPFYKMSINEKNVALSKSTDASNCFSVSFKDFEYVGEPVTIRTSEYLEHIIKLFVGERDVVVNCIDGKMLHFSQSTNTNMKKDFAVMGISRE